MIDRLRTLVATAIWWFIDEHLGSITHKLCCDTHYGFLINQWACEYAAPKPPKPEPDPADEIEWVAWKLRTDLDLYFDLCDYERAEEERLAA